MIKGIIFDLDGVLINSDEALVKHFKATLEKFGFKSPPEREMIKHAGKTQRDWIRALLPREKQNDEKLINKMDEYAYKIYWDYYLSKFVKLNEGAETVLKNFSEKFKVAIDTSNPKETVRGIFKKFNLEKYFDVVITLEDIERPKPSAESLLKAVARLGLSPSEVLYIGDSEIDVECGKNAGVKTVIVGKRKLKNKPQYAVKTLSELLKIIKNNSTKEKETK